MSVLRFFTDQLSILVTSGYTDSNGDYIEDSKTWETCDKCMAVPAGSSNEIKFDDGTVRRYSFVCYLKADCQEYKDGDTVKLLRNGREYIFDVKGFHRYQLQSKLWL